MDYKKGDIVVCEIDLMGIQGTMLITALVVDGFKEETNDNIAIEYANPLTYMSGLKNEPKESIRFGDTETYIHPSKVISHYRLSADE